MPQTPDSLIDVICNQTLIAASDIIRSKAIKTDLGIICASLKEVVSAGYAGLMAEMKEADDCRMGEPMLKAILSAGCTKFALDALKACGAIAAE